MMARGEEAGMRGGAEEEEKSEEEGGRVGKSLSVSGQVVYCPALVREEAGLFWDYITRITVMRSRWAPVVAD